MNRAARTGHGRWCTIITPCPGILWTNDTDTVAFEPIPSDEVDPTPIHNQIDATHATAGATQTFNILAALIGKHQQTGDLNTWTPDTPSHRPDLGTPPPMTSTAEVWQALNQ